MQRLGTVAVAIATLVLTASASAATFTVNDTSDAPLATPTGTSCVSTATGGGCTLRAAVQAADNTGGANAIALASGHFKLTIAPTGTTGGSDTNDPAHGDLDLINHDALTITGAGSSSTTVDANEIDRAFAVQNGSSLTLSKLSIENGNAQDQSSGSQNGGSIYSDGGLTITGDVKLTANTTVENGGAIYVDADATAFGLTGASLDDNSAYQAGAIWFTAATLPLAVTNSTFTGNTATNKDGGAIVDDSSGPFTVTNSTFSDNSTPTPGGSWAGGAISMQSNSPLTVTGSEFDHNAADFGSAIDDLASSSETISSTTFTDNTAATYGTMRIGNASGAQDTLTNDEFDGNRAGDAGGAIRWEDGKLTIVASSLVGNRAGLNAGGLYVGSTSALSVTNTTISGNHATKGGGLFINAAAPVALTNDTIALNTATPGNGGGIWDASTAGAGSTVVNTIVGDNAGSDCGGSAFAAAADSGNNLDSDASCFGGLGVTSDKTGVDPLVSDAAANGGPVKTDALGTGSPAIDSAKASACPSTDARGVMRPQGAGCDIGAVEASTPTVTITAPQNGSTFVQGSVVKASYSCAEAGLSSLIASCTGPVGSGGPIDTRSPGSHTFSVTAIDDQGQVVATAVQYTVKLPPPPNTKITSHHVSGDTVTLKFKGTGGSGALHFMCRIGARGAKFKKCSSPKTYTHLSKGRHRIAVKAVDSIGQSDPTPATIRVKIK